MDAPALDAAQYHKKHTEFIVNYKTLARNINAEMRYHDTPFIYLFII